MREREKWMDEEGAWGKEAVDYLITLKGSLNLGKKVKWASGSQQHTKRVWEEEPATNNRQLKAKRKHMLVLMSIDYVDDYFWVSCWLFLAEYLTKNTKGNKPNARKASKKEAQKLFTKLRNSSEWRARGNKGFLPLRLLLRLQFDDETFREALFWGWEIFSMMLIAIDLFIAITS